jgi:ubiquinone biosynthesis protein COQ9
MLDTATIEGRIITAALSLAAEKKWGDLALVEIAERAGVDLVELKGQFASKSDILAAFGRVVDDTVLRQTPKPALDEAPRDRLFEVIMCRLDLLQPHKAALRSIVADTRCDPTRLPSLLQTQRWMMEAAGIATDGVEGGLRMAGLAAVYASVVRTWLEDDDAGHARTMAALDRRLRRGEQTLRQLHDVRRGVGRAGDVIADLLGRWRAGASGRRGDASPSGAAPPPGADVSPPATP